MAYLVKAAQTFFRQRPLVANCVIYGSLYVAAEFTQQTIRIKFLDDPPQAIDTATLGRYAVMGTFVYSPILYTWYKWLDRTLPGTAKKTIIKKVLLDQFIPTPLLLVLFFTGMSIMEGQKNIFQECEHKFLPTFARSCLFWMPAQTINFCFVAPRFRVIYVGSCSFMWASILCFVKRQRILHDPQH